MSYIVKALQRHPDGYLQEVPLGQPLVLTTPYQATLSVDAANYDILRITLEGDLHLDIQNTGMDGQKLLLELTQDAVGNHKVTFGGTISWGHDIKVFDATAEPLATDVVGLVRHSPSSTWRIIAVAKGY